MLCDIYRVTVNLLLKGTWKRRSIQKINSKSASKFVWKQLVWDILLINNSTWSVTLIVVSLGNQEQLLVILLKQHNILKYLYNTVFKFSNLGNLSDITSDFGGITFKLIQYLYWSNRTIVKKHYIRKELNLFTQIKMIATSFSWRKVHNSRENTTWS